MGSGTTLRLHHYTEIQDQFFPGRLLEEKGVKGSINPLDSGWKGLLTPPPSPGRVKSDPRQSASCACLQMPSMQTRLSCFLRGAKMRMKSFGEHSELQKTVSWWTWTKSRSLKPLSSGSSRCFRNVCFVSAKMGRENPNSLTVEKPPRKHMSSTG